MNVSRQPRVFISRTTAGLASLAERVAEVVRQWAIEPIIQTVLYPFTPDRKGVLANRHGYQLKTPSQIASDLAITLRAN